MFCHVGDTARREVVDRTLAGAIDFIEVNDTNCAHPLETRPGQCWIDFPLHTRDRILGKLTVDCKPDYPPEDREFLKVLCQMTSEFLDASIEREERLAKERTAQRKGVQGGMRRIFHKLNNFISPLDTQIERLTLKGSQDKDLRSIADEVGSAYEAIADVINSADRYILFEEPRFRQADLLSSIRETLASLATIKDAHVSVCCNEDCLNAEFDPDLLRLVWEELATNSAKSSSPKPLEIRVNVSVHSGEIEWILVDFIDNGLGIDRDNKGKIFELFESDRRSGRKGHGFGLWMVKDIIEVHDGSIEERGIPGKGACFHMELPRYATPS